MAQCKDFDWLNIGIQIRAGAGFFLSYWDIETRTNEGIASNNIHLCPVFLVTLEMYSMNWVMAVEELEARALTNQL